MPIIPVELDYEPGGRDYCIGRELHGKRALPLMFNAYRVQHGVTKRLGFCHLPRLLDYLHLYKHFPTGGVSVPAPDGAVSNPIVSGRATGRGPPERVSADFTLMFSFVPPLILIVAVIGAESRTRLNAVLGYIKRLPTLFAIDDLSVLPLGAWRSAVAAYRTVFPAGRHPLSDSLPACDAGDCSDFVSLYTFCHTPSIPQLLNRLE